MPVPHFSPRDVGKFPAILCEQMNQEFDAALQALPKYLLTNEEFITLLSDEICAHYSLAKMNIKRLEMLAMTIMEEECPNAPCRKCIYYMGKEYSSVNEGSQEVTKTRCLGLLLNDITKQF